jgi:hypothetical protein
MVRTGLTTLCTLALLAIGGCTQPKPIDSFTVAPADYPAAFEAAKRVLVDERFELDRVDFRAGIITTRRKDTSGLATPWDTEQSTLTDEFDDLLNRHARLVAVMFVPAGTTESPSDGASLDVASATTPLTVRIDATVYRERWPGRRIEPKAVRFSSFTRDTDLAARGLWPRFQAPHESDRLLTNRLLGELQAACVQPD